MQITGCALCACLQLCAPIYENKYSKALGLISGLDFLAMNALHPTIPARKDKNLVA